MSHTQKTAVVTGASSGFGFAIAQRLQQDGWQVFAGARRVEKMQPLVALGVTTLPLDVTNSDSAQTFIHQLPEQINLLVNNAGGAFGADTLLTMNEAQWQAMYDVNVLGLARMTRLCHPKLLASGDGHLINISSIAGFETYIGGAGYTAVKHGVKAITETCRLEWLGQPIRITEIAPGAAETEFSLIRFQGDANKAAAVYQGMTPLVAADIAESVAWVSGLPCHMNIDTLVIRPRDQARADKVYRRKE